MGLFDWFRRDPAPEIGIAVTEASGIGATEEIRDESTDISGPLAILNGLTDFSIGTVKASFDAYFWTRNATEQTLDFLGVIDQDEKYARFEAVGETKQQDTITQDELTGGDIEFLKDSISAARHGYLDESQLKRKGLLDKDGYVLDSKAIYQLNPGRWEETELTWAEREFDLIRVREKEGFVFGEGPYQANVALLQNVETGEYAISVGGTNSIADVNTDIWGLVFAGNTLGHGRAVTSIIDEFFAEDIPEGASVDIFGHSLGGGEALLQYRQTPERFDDVVVLQAVGIGGQDGTYYDQFVFDGQGDENIIEIFGDDPDNDFNDAVTYWGHVGAGTVYDLTEVGSDGGIELLDSHLLEGVWNALPQEEDQLLMA